MMTTKACAGSAVLAVVAIAYAAASDQVVARVGGEAVTGPEVDRELRLAKADEPADEAVRAKLWRAALDQVIDRRLVLGYLTKIGEAASAKDIDLALAQFENELKAQNLTLDQHSQNVGMSKDEVRRALAWKVSWKRYCDKQLTPMNLEKYFERYRRDFDGTQLRVAQILFKVPADADGAAVAAAKDEAAKVRGRNRGRTNRLCRRRQEPFGRAQPRGRGRHRLDREAAADAGGFLAGGICSEEE
jgi:hypothetical protein